MLKLINTLGHERQEFIPIKPGFVSFYHCGPTVYWNQHIGNMRGMLMGDLIRRSLEYLGYEVRYVRNYTDFGHLTSDADEGEDKMEKASKREHLDPQTVANKYIKQFELDTARLHIKPPTVTARATDYLKEMVTMVSELLEKGYAYSTPQAVYFEVSKFPDYTQLSGQNLSDNITGAGTGTVLDPGKRHPADFALWFFKTGAHKNALQFWPSPFSSPEVENGLGFPGWHIECSAMIRKELGKTIDIHMGGIEHIPVHHTNEIAQSESANGVKFVNYWLHNEWLTLNDKKIAKSDGNFILVADLISKGYDPLDLRYLFLQSHYRSKQNFTWEALDAARTSFLKLGRLVSVWKQDKTIGHIIPEFQKGFTAALEDDFNIPRALAVVWEVVKSSAPDADKLATILDFDKVLGLGLTEASLEIGQQAEQSVTPEISDLVAQRESARGKQDWATADRIRDELKDKYGYLVQDKKVG